MPNPTKPTDKAVIDALFEHSPSAIYLKDASGRYLRVGKGFTQITGLSSIDVLGKHDSTLFPDGIGEPFIENDRAVLESGQRLEIEEILTESNLGTRYFHTVKMPVLGEKKNDVIAVFGVSTEITHLRRMGKAIKEISDQTSKHSGQSFLDAISITLAKVLDADYLAIGLVSADEKYINTNILLHRVQKLENFSVPLQGSPCENVLRDNICIYPNNLSLLFPSSKTITETNAQAYIGIAITDENNKTIGVVFALYARPLTDTRFVSEILSVFAGRIYAEIAKEKQNMQLEALKNSLEEQVTHRTEELTSALAELDSFGYTVAHDLKGPIRAMNGLTEMLAEHLSEKLDEEAKGFIERIQRAGLKLNQQIDAILKLTRLSRQSINWQSLDISNFATEVYEHIKPLYATTQCTLQVQKGIRCFGDKALTETVLNNLIENAFKYRHSDRPLEISITSKKENGFVYISIADNGVGFDPVYADKLFKPFSRLHSGKDISGDGIGLASIAKIITRHGGSFSATGQVQRGATFCFSLPSSAP